MESQQSEGRDRILVLDSNSDDLRLTSESIAKQIPASDVTKVASASDFRSAIHTKTFDVVVLDQNLSDADGLQLIQELKLQEYEPSVVVVSSSQEPMDVAAAYNMGCHRCIVKEGSWVEQLGPTVRHLLRLRRLEDERERLIAKFSEANYLLSEKNRRLDEFAGTIAHDIRGPLGGINMRLEYMLDIYKDEVDERLATLLQNTFDSSQRLIGIVQAMYEFAKIGVKAQRIEELDLTALVAEVVDDLQYDKSLVIKVGMAELPKVWGNAALLRKVFINLINNSVKYSDKKEIVINIGFSRIIERSLGSFLEFFVEDNGPGIAKDDQRDMFTIFRRGTNAEQYGEGTGIGLSVVKRVIELHFGNISLESEPDQGTKFVMSLPMEDIQLAV